MSQQTLKQFISSPWYWALPTVVLFAIAVVVMTSSNHDLFLILNSALYITNKYIWLNVTLFGDAAMAAIILLPLIGRRTDIIWAAIIAGIITAIFVSVGKNYFAIPRPPAVLDGHFFHQIGNLFTVKSFPSGHTAAAFSVASVVVLSIRQSPIKFIVLLYALLIGLSRIAIGAHWPMDVLAGAIIGWFPGVIGVLFAQKKLLQSKTAEIFPAALLVSTAYYLVFVHQRGDVEARLLEVAVPTICVLLALPGLLKIIKNRDND